MAATTPAAGTPVPTSGWGALVARRPLTAFLVLALGIGWVSLGVPVALGIDSSPFLILMLLGLLVPSLLVTRAADGWSGVRRLLARAFQWRFGLVRWAVVVFAMPVITLALAAATGTLVDPAGGWFALTGWYLFNTLIFGALLANLWEETAWAGFAQTRLMARHGLILSSLLTAVPFALIHIPLYVADAATASELARNLVLLFALAPVYRYLLGVHMLDSRGSVLAVGIQHAAWNASGKLEAVAGAWQVIAAVLVLTVLVAVQHLLGRPSTGRGRAAEQAAARDWLLAPQRQKETLR